MAFVITSACIEEQAADCVMVCPVDCIELGETQYFINPDTCIDCGACVAACPVDAIYYDEDLLPEDLPFLELAKTFYNIA